MAKAQKKPRTAKQVEADKKNLANWEAKQAEANRISDNKEVAEISYKEGYDKGHIDGYLIGSKHGEKVGYIAGFENKKSLSYVNMLSGFVLGAVTVLIAAFIALGL